MDELSLHSKPLEGLGRRRRPGRLAAVGLWAMAVWSVGCLGVIGVGLNRLYPQTRVQLAAAPLVAAVPARDRPYPSCAAAHADGVYDIPLGSSAYSPRQDGDGDGLACEPAP